MYYGKYEEVLLLMNSVFRIGDVTSIDGNTRLVEVQLDLATDKDNDLRELMDYIREETYPWLGVVLLKMDEPVKTQQVYETLLERESEEKAITYYEKLIEIKEKHIPRDDLGLATGYSMIGNVYSHMSDYSKALSFHEKALIIRQESLSSTDLELAESHMNIGITYESMGDYAKTLSSHEEALIIQQQSLPSNHPSFAGTYGNIGLPHKTLGNYPEALSCFECAADIAQCSLPANHPELQRHRNDLVEIKELLAQSL